MTAPSPDLSKTEAPAPAIEPELQPTLMISGRQSAPTALVRGLVFGRREPMLGVAIVLFAAFAFISPLFASLGNVENILRQTGPVLLLGVGMTLVVLVGAIDLSVGSIVIASAVAAGVALVSGLPSAVAMLAAIGVGAGVGAVNAFFIEALRISPVIVTLGTMIALRGLALVFLGEYSSWITIKDPAFGMLAKARIVGLPLDAAIVLLLSLLCWVALVGTLPGRRLYAVGDNERAARLSGLQVRGYRAVAYIACGTFAGLAGILYAARTGIVSPSIGIGLEFFAIATVALGAGGLPAGRVKISQTLIGALILMMVFNYMTIRGVPGTWQTTVTGGLLLAAMVLGRFVQGRGAGEAASSVAASLQIRSGRLAQTLGGNAVVGAIVALAVAFAIVNPRFATLANGITLIEQNATLAIVAVGAMIGVVSRCLDISPGSVVALGAVAAALAFQAGWSVPLSLCAGVATCLTVYLLNGLVVGKLGLDPLIVTLAAWIWARGLAVSLTNARTLPFDLSFVGFMNSPLVGGFTPGVVLIGVAFLAGWVVLARLPIGMRLYALGADPRMLRQAGIADGATRLKALLLMGCFTAAGMLVMLGRLGAAAPTAGFGLELDAIVAVIIGGASFRGGEARLRDTATGVLFLSVLNNGLSGLQMGDAGFFLIKGSAILSALSLRSVARFLPDRKTA
jgi:ribose/xylose/arabinose/galactoside ABC-type transport system permease subunit